jgi:hypothetical protein
MMSGNDRPKHMMLGPVARTYFSELEKTSSSGKFRILLQKYWLCAFVGLLADKKASREENDKWVNDYFPEPLKSNQHLIRASAFFRFADRLEYTADDEDDLLEGMKFFFDDEKLAKLGEDGLDTLDEFAAGGFEIINNKIPEPNDLALFLVDYVNLIESYESNKN